MQIVGDGDRRGLVEAQEVGDDPLEGGQGLGRLQVADVLADEDLTPDAEGDGVLQMRAHGQNGRQRLGDSTGSGA